MSDVEESFHEDHLDLPGIKASSLVNSPTTDTLDSVTLEPSPAEEHEEEGNESLNTSRTGKEETEEHINSQQKYIDKALKDSPTKAQGSTFDDIQTTTTDSSIISDGQETRDSSEIFQSGIQVDTKQYVPEVFSAVDSLEADVTHICHREHKISQSEPETIAFEGEEEGNDEVNTISELTEKDEFDSFTAQGSENNGPEPTPTPTHHGSFVERSNSAPAGHPTNGPHSNQHMRQDEVTSGLQSLSVGTTPTQMSPLSTPVHQPAFGSPSSPQTTPVEPPRFDRQASVPTSPYHSHPDSGPPSGTFQPFSDMVGTDDIFTASLSMSDSDRRFDAWIPSDATRHILLTMATSTGLFIPTSEQLSTPGVLSNEPLGDPVRDLVYRYMGEQEAIRRHVLTADAVSQDFDGLRKLTEGGCLRAAVDLTARLLAASGQGEGRVGQITQHSQQTLQLWFFRLALLVKLRLYEMAESEIRAFQNLDTPDLYFEFYPQLYPCRRGSMVCFAMRLLHADLPHLNGRSQETLDRLYYILAVVRKIISNLDNELCEDGSAAHLPPESRKVSRELWVERERQVLYKIANILLSVRDYQAALAVYNSLLEKDGTKRADLLTGISRIHLQMGNVTKANEIHSEVEKAGIKSDSFSAIRNAMNKGLSAMCLNNFSEAYSYFKTAVQLEPDNTCAVNNMAVCSLYLGRLKDALNTLEAIVHSDPARNLHEGILFNLCTLYELESSRALHKKQAVLDLVSKHKGDGFSTACLKMA
ncbi:trafficking protein particle complex subunit 12-like isoform X2 [Pomacea canaliculata]|uniref:trafficking protein particle complex subunit 12-like isoform X2 n=1 Tax=Pomacea canaliculata TaxID=400727 RepID=UPI000D73441C|nr:trafficking protein particle complex subunit 12-like isoform X2 [Pomacea canaliculata]